jgi:hypothetical protein
LDALTREVPLITFGLTSNSNRYRTSTINKLCALIQHHQTIENLLLYGNHFSEKEVSQIIEALAGNQSIKKIKIAGRALNFEFCSSLFAQFITQIVTLVQKISSN